MKRNKRRIDARLKPFLFERIERIASFTESTYTEVMEEALERGLNWMKNKIKKELDPAFDWKEQAPVQLESTGTPKEFLEDQDMQRMIEIAKTKWIGEDD